MIVGAVTGPDFFSAKQQVIEATDGADAIELRLDLFIDFGAVQLSRLMDESELPFIFTYRPKQYGGQYSGSYAARLKTVYEILQLNPEYFDLEFDFDRGELEKLHLKFPNVKLIASYHDYQKTPQDLSAVLARMQHPAFSVYKLVTYANSSIDALRMLQFVYSHRDIYPMTGFCMGDYGMPTRILVPVVGGLFTYAYIDGADPIAPGQLSVNTLLRTYHYHHLDRDTRIYALIGNPVEGSVGHMIHNQGFCMLERNAVYVKFKLSADELAAFFKYSIDLPFYGFSVTMPLKRDVVSFMDELAPDVQLSKAVNTIVRHHGKLLGSSTDGRGAIAAIEEHIRLSGKTVLVIGSGGTAGPIAYEAKQRGAKVIILNRTLKTAERLAHAVGCQAYALTDANKIAAKGYDVLVNTTPLGMADGQLPIPSKAILAKKVVMDVVYRPMETPLLMAAKKKGCRCIYGHEMFVNQALLQLETWFGTSQ